MPILIILFLLIGIWTKLQCYNVDLIFEQSSMVMYYLKYI